MPEINNSLPVRRFRTFLGVRVTKKRIIWTVIIVLILGLAGFGIFRPKNNTSIQTDTVKRQDLKQTVLATGQVTSKTDLSLSFKTSGVVTNVSAVVGQKVKTGQALANLQQSDVLAGLTQARGALAQAQANYQKVLAGASSEEVAVAQVALDNAKSALQTTKNQQQVLVDNAYKALMNSTLSAEAGIGNTTAVTVTVSGVYNAQEQGSYKITIYFSGSGVQFQYNGLETGSGIVSTTPQPLGNRGLYIAFSSVSGMNTNDSWTVSIPNTQAATYVANYNAYQSALQAQSSAVSAAQNAVLSAQAALDLKKAQARPADLQAAEAQVLSAQGQVQAASANLENTILRAPADGTITSVDIKPGELATALKEALILQDIGNLHVEANVSEANIASIKPDQSVEVTFDALGTDRKFSAKVQSVDPASTLVSGVVNYKVVISLNKIDEIKPGMTANISVLTGEKQNALAVPARAVINQDNKKYVRVITDKQKLTYNQVEVSTGMEADGGLLEITSGLNQGQEVVTYIKNP